MIIEKKDININVCIYMKYMCRQGKNFTIYLKMFIRLLDEKKTYFWS